MFKLTNETFGQIEIQGQTLKYKQYIIVRELNEDLIKLIQNKIVKSKLINEQENKPLVLPKKTKKKRGRKKKEEVIEKETKEEKLIEDEEI